MQKTIGLLVLCLVMLLGTHVNAASQALDTLPPKPTYKIISPAKFIGGAEEWKRFLTIHLQGDVPTKNNAPEGMYTARARFIINLDGSIEGITLVQDPGFGTGEEFIRVLKLSSGKWEPAVNDSQQKVRSMLMQPITFMVEGLKSKPAALPKKPS